MKKIYVMLLVTAGFVLSAQAQPFEKGDKLLGGSIGFLNSSSGSNSSNTSIYINPSFGFFTKSNRLTGFSLSFASNNPSYKQRSFSASVYKQYWNSLGKNIYFIMEGRIAAGYSTFNVYSSNSNDEQKSKYYSLSGSLSPGLAYRINRRLVIDAFFSNFVVVADSYERRKTISSFGQSISHNNQIDIRTGLSGFSFNNIQFGFRYILK